MARYIGRYGTKCVAKAVLLAAVPPIMLKSASNPEDQIWLCCMQAGLKNAYESIKSFSETDQTDVLKKFDVPTLVLHGEDDQIVPVKDSAKKSARLVKDAKEIYYPGAPHGLTATHQDQVNRDLLAFLRS